jgi:hypothetical protein
VKLQVFVTDKVVLLSNSLILELFSSPRVFFLRRELFFFTLGEELFAESSWFGSHQRVFLSAKSPFPVVPASRWASVLAF